MKNNELVELQTRFDSRASFYKKAYVLKKGKELKLYSYETLVAIIKSDDTVLIDLEYSSTTNRHIKEFLKQNGFKADTKKQMKQDYKSLEE